MEINLENCPRQQQREHVTMLQWKVAKTAVTMGRFTRILHGGNRLQLWAVYSFLKVGASHLNFIHSL
jgi:hypothetical protein